MNKLQALAIDDIERFAITAQELLHKIARGRQFVDAICTHHTVENELMTLLRKIQSTADAVGEDQ